MFYVLQQNNKTSKQQNKTKQQNNNNTNVNKTCFALLGIEPKTFSVQLHATPYQGDHGHVKETRYHCATAQKLSVLNSSITRS